MNDIEQAVSMVERVQALEAVTTSQQRVLLAMTHAMNQMTITLHQQQAQIMALGMRVKALDDGTCPEPMKEQGENE